MLSFLTSYIVHLLVALLFTSLLLFLGTWIGSIVMQFCSKIVYVWMERKMFIMGYHCFYPNTRAVEKDVKCRQLLQTLREVYNKDSNFNAYCTRLSEERLPINVFMNWTRSVAEDIFAAPLPSAKMDQWNHFFKSKLYHHISIFYSDFPEYEDNEFGCLWGGIYFWLLVSFEKDMNDSIMERIVKFGCRMKPSMPYFQHFFNQARNCCGQGYHLPGLSTSAEEMFVNGMSAYKISSDSISASEVYDGYESLSVSERCNARRVFNDVLPDSTGWKTMRNEMKHRGWFKESIYPYATKIINGDIIEGDKVDEKTVISKVENYKPEIQTQNNEIPMPSIGQDGNNLMTE